MTRYNASNNWTTYLDGPLGSDVGDTALNVVSPSGHPAVPFKITIGEEIMNVTAASGSTFTVERAAEGTTRTSHVSGSKVENRPTAGVLNDLWDEVDGHTGSTGDAHGVATDLVDGFMDSADKIRLDNMDDNANNYSHPGTVQCNAATTSGTYVNLRAQSTTKDDVGLGNVDNNKQARSAAGYNIVKNGSDANGNINFKT